MKLSSSAAQDFQRARQRVALQELMARLTGKSTELLSYEEVRQMVRASGVVSRSLREVPVSNIVGSVSRYNDFTRTFLPKLDSDLERWSRVKVAVEDLAGLPPVELYQIGDVYFVVDGHHRISVARQNGADQIQAFVTEIRSKVPLTADIQPDHLILKAEQAEFLQSTRLDRREGGPDLGVTCLGQYEKLAEHIEVHRHFLGLEQQREIPFDEAADHWYDHVYLPVVETIRELAVLRAFPGRTEADLYLWLSSYRAEIAEQLGWEVTFSAAAADLAEQQGTHWSRIAARVGKRVLDVVVPDELESGPDPGQWRRERSADRSTDRLFAEILVAISGVETSWLGLEQAIEIGRRENSQLVGIYVAGKESEKESDEAMAIRDRFYWRCGEVGLEAKFVVEVGPVARTISDRARWADLVVANLAHPPGSSVLSRFRTGYRKLVNRCSRPVLAVPGLKTALARPLLVYDAVASSREALFVAAYLSEQWQLPLTVTVAADIEQEAEALAAEAQRYLRNNEVESTCLVVGSNESEAVLSIAAQENSDLIIMGGYSANPLLGVIRGTLVDRMLGGIGQPLLICH